MPLLLPELAVQAKVKRTSDLSGGDPVVPEESADAKPPLHHDRNMSCPHPPLAQTGEVAIWLFTRSWLGHAL